MALFLILKVAVSKKNRFFFWLDLQTYFSCWVFEAAFGCDTMYFFQRTRRTCKSHSVKCVTFLSSLTKLLLQNFFEKRAKFFYYDISHSANFERRIQFDGRINIRVMVLSSHSFNKIKMTFFLVLNPFFH